MALAGIGVDMLEIARMERTMRRRPSFLRRVFTEEERAYCDACARPAEHYAARFAAREAVVKALGTGFSNGVGFSDVSVTMDAQGRPRALLSGRAAQIAREGGVREVAVANAVAVTDEVRPQPEDRPDPERELAASFREARSVLDELERAQDGIMADVPAESSVVDTQMTQEEGEAGGPADASVPVEPAKE